MEQYEEEYEVEVIPENTEFDVNIFGFTFKTGRLVQAIIIGGALGGLCLYLCLGVFHMKVTTTIGYTAVFVFGGGAFGIKGINGDSVFGYLLNIMNFNQTKRITRYNKRVKNEKKFFIDEYKDDSVVSNDKLDAIYKQFFNTKNYDEIENNLKEEKMQDNMVFEDDIELFGMPENLMSPKELKKYQKKKAKEEKKRLKIKRKEIENAKKEARKNKVAGI